MTGRRLPALLAAAGCATLAVLLSGGTAVAAPAATPPATGAPATVSIWLDGVDSPAITPGSTLTMTGQVRNDGSKAIQLTKVQVKAGWEVLDRAGIAGWLTRPLGEGTEPAWAEQSRQVTVPPGRAVGFTLTAVADDLRLGGGADAFGPRGVTLEAVGNLGNGLQTLAQARTFTVWQPTATAVPAVRLAILAPLVRRSPAAQAGALDPPLLADLRPGGRIDRILTSAADTPLTWALDPALLTAAAGAVGTATTGTGTATPTPSVGPSATPSSGRTLAADDVAAADALLAWVKDPRPRTVYQLPWGDPDLSALAHARSEDPAVRARLETLLRTAVEDGARTTSEALGRTLPDLAWPVDGLADVDTVQTAQSVGLRTAAVATSVVGGGRAGLVHAGLTSAPSLGAVLVDSPLSTAAAGLGGSRSAQAVQRMLADLAAVAVAQRDSGLHPVSATQARTVVGDVLTQLPRSWDPTPSVALAGFDRLKTASWVQLAPLPALQQTVTTRSVRPTQVSPREISAAQLQTLGLQLEKIDAFAPVLASGPDHLLANLRAGVLSLAGQSWRSDSNTLTADIQLTGEATSRLYDSVGIVQGSGINFYATTGQISVIVTNSLPQPVDVVLSLHPNSGRLIVPETKKVHLDAAPAGGSVRAAVKIQVRAVANGLTRVEATLLVPGTGVTVVTADPPIDVNVQRDWENRGLIVASSVLGGLLVFGLARGVRRGRLERLPPEAAPDPDDVGDEPGPWSDGLRGWPHPRRRHDDDPPHDDPSHDDPSHDDAAPGGGPSGGAAVPAGEPWRTEVAFADAAATGAMSVATTERDRSSGENDEVGLARQSAIMTAGTLVSRILGQGRVSLLSAAIGSGLVGDAFNVANTLPNSLFILIGGGVLNAVLVPQIARAARNPDGGKDYVDRLLTLSILILGGATLVLTALAPILISMASKGWSPSTFALATAFGFWFLPQIFFYGLYTLFGQVLNARGSFGPFMWAPVVNNVVAIGGLLAFILLGRGAADSPGGCRLPAQWSAFDITLLAGTTTLGVVAQALVLIPALRRIGYRWQPRWGWRGVGLRTAGHVAVWTFAGVAVAQAGFFVTSRIATQAGAQVASAGPCSTSGPGRTVFDYAYLLFMLPHSLVAVSLVTAAFTSMSVAARDGQVGRVREQLSNTVRLTAVPSLLATAAFLVLGQQITAVIFPGSSQASTQQYAAVATAMLLGLAPFSAQYLLQRVFYAYEDARTPFVIGTLSTAVWVGGNLVAARVLPPDRVVVGVGLAMSLSNLVGAGVALPLLRRRIGRLDGSAIASTYLRLAAAAGVAAVGAWAVRSGMYLVTGPGYLSDALVLVLAGATLVILYAVAARALRVTELAALVEPVRARLGR